MKKRSSRFAWSLMLPAALVVACSSGSSKSNGSGDAGSGGEDASVGDGAGGTDGGSDGRSGDGGSQGCPPGTYDLGNTGSCDYKCTPTQNAPNDPIDPGFVDDNCDGTDGVVARCLFVASDGTDAPTAGTRLSPMKTIAYAIAQATAQGGKDVCLSAETYLGEVDLASGVSVYGGFNEHDPSFAFRRGATPATTLSYPVVPAGRTEVIRE